MNYYWLLVVKELGGARLGLRPAELLVLKTMCGYADDQGGNCYPSQPRVAYECGISERYVRKLLKRLVEVYHFLAIDQAAHRYDTVHYRITIPEEMVHATKAYRRWCERRRPVAVERAETPARAETISTLEPVENSPAIVEQGGTVEHAAGRNSSSADLSGDLDQSGRVQAAALSRDDAPKCSTTTERAAALARHDEDEKRIETKARRQARLSEEERNYRVIEALAASVVLEAPSRMYRGDEGPAELDEELRTRCSVLGIVYGKGVTRRAAVSVLWRRDNGLLRRAQ